MAFEVLLKVHSAEYVDQNALMVGYATRGSPACVGCRSTDDDPLISSCNCNGSIRYVHLGCLRHWIKGRLNLSDSMPNGTCAGQERQEESTASWRSLGVEFLCCGLMAFRVYLAVTIDP